MCLTSRKINPHTDIEYSPAALMALETASKLPVTKYMDQIVDLVRKNDVTILEGETGSGKSI